MDHVIGDFVADWKLSGKAGSTAYTYATVLRRFARTYPLQPTKADAGAHLTTIDTPATRQFHCRALRRSAPGFAEEFDEVDGLTKLKHVKVDQAPPQRIAPDDVIERLLRSIKGGPFSAYEARRNAAIVTLFRDSGMRRGELAQLRLEDVDLDSGAVVLRKTKAKHGRVVPLSRDAKRAPTGYLLSRRNHALAESEWLWLGARTPMNRHDAISALFTRLCRDAGVKVKAHELRRRMAYEWARKGGSDDTLMRVCGWSTATMPGRYRSQLVDELAAEQFAKIVG